MSQSKKYPLLNVNKNDFPKQNEEKKTVITVNKDLAGALSVEQRVLNVTTENYTLQGIQHQIVEFDRAIASFHARKKFFEELLAYAEEKGDVPKNDMEIKMWMKKNEIQDDIKKLEEKKDKEPEEIATLKALKRSLDSMGKGETADKK